MRERSSCWLTQCSMVVRGTVAGNNCLTEMILTFKVRDQSLCDPGSPFANIEYAVAVDADLISR